MRKYDAPIKAEVIGMMAAGRPVPDIARSLGIGEKHNLLLEMRSPWLRKTNRSTPTASSQVSLSEHLALQNTA